VRRFWKGDTGVRPALAARLIGSADLFGHHRRRPWASVNFVTAHDGFTLKDLVSYNDKHNEANGEDNRDGGNDNESFNWGAEGPTDDPGILARAKRSSARC
jgi:isoamylase